MHHSRLAAGLLFGSSLIQNGSLLIFARPPTLIGLGLLWSCPVLCGVARVSRLTSRRGSDPLPGRAFPFRGVRYLRKVGALSFISMPRGFYQSTIPEGPGSTLKVSRDEHGECEDGKQ